jgi:transposase
MENNLELLSDSIWAQVLVCLPAQPLAHAGPRPRDNRACFTGILWVLQHAARWRDLPAHLPSGSTCWRRLQYWHACEAWPKAWRAYFAALDDAALQQWAECLKSQAHGRASNLPALRKPGTDWTHTAAKIFFKEARRAPGLEVPPSLQQPIKELALQAFLLKRRC